MRAHNAAKCPIHCAVLAALLLVVVLPATLLPLSAEARATSASGPAHIGSAQHRWTSRRAHYLLMYTHTTHMEQSDVVVTEAQTEPTTEHRLLCDTCIQPRTQCAVLGHCFVQIMPHTPACTSPEGLMGRPCACSASTPRQSRAR